MVLGEGLGDTHTEEDDPEPAALHHVCSLADLLGRDTGNDIGQPLALEGNAECIQELVVPALLDLQVDIGHLGGVGDTGVDNDQLAAHLSLAGEETTREDGVPGHVPGVGVCRVAAPEDDPVGTVLDFPKGTGGETDILHGNQGGAVAGCCGIVTAGLAQISAISLPTLWASQLVDDQPNMRGFFAFASIWAEYSTASS